jgi:ferritin-like metal-binding protein YciE
METNPSIVTLHNLLDFNAGRFACAEAEVKKGLSEWIKEANSMQLKAVLQRYLDFATEHIVRINRFINDEKLTFINCNDAVMLALIGDTGESLSYCADAAVKDACLLAGVQCINHYKISKYGTAAAYANDLDLDKAASLFHELEINEKHIDDRLSQLAKYEINIKAKTPVVLPG